MPTPLRKDIFFKDIKRIVIKVGSNILTTADGLNLYAVRDVTRQICWLTDRGIETILVTSGAMAAGMKKVGLRQRPEETPQRQAVAAVGQSGLIMEYENAFDRYGIKVAQILLTSDGMSNRKRYLNARNTLNTLLNWKVVPIINENDTVAVESIQFGDNDSLAAMITLLMDADLLINLTDIEGLYDKDPRKYADAKLIEEVTTVNQELERIATGIPGALGTGGMLTKIKAAKQLTAAGTPMIIADGSDDHIVQDLFEGRDRGTFFVPKPERLSSRKRWIGYAMKPEGAIHIDEGATTAILTRGKSLLPSGIMTVAGEFDAGAPITVHDRSGKHLGIGLVNYNAAAIRQIKGLQSSEIKARLGDKPYDEVIHRDNLVITKDD